MIQMIIDVTQPMVFMGKCHEIHWLFSLCEKSNRKIVEGLADKDINKG